MPPKGSSFKVGVYVDVANIYNNGGQRMQYDVLREFALPIMRPDSSSYQRISFTITL